MNPEEPTLYGPDGVQRTPSLAPFEAEQGQEWRASYFAL
jgi:hypothetical protein